MCRTRTSSQYAPGAAAVKRAGLPAAYPFKTEADLFLWIYERRRDLRVFDVDADFDAGSPSARVNRPCPYGTNCELQM